MGKRPVFVPINEAPYVKSIMTDVYLSYGAESVVADRLHRSFKEVFPEAKTLEVSTASMLDLGMKLSAFKLEYKLSNGQKRPVECVFQSSKCFTNGKQYVDLLDKYPWEAKKDIRLRSSGYITSFCLEGVTFPIQPTTFFYDWIYMKSLSQNPEKMEEVVRFDSFTDIFFNPAKSLNCQAKTVAAFVSLYKAGLLDEALRSPEDFKRIVYGENT